MDLKLMHTLLNYRVLGTSIVTVLIIMYTVVSGVHVCNKFI